MGGEGKVELCIFFKACVLTVRCTLPSYTHHKQLHLLLPLLRALVPKSFALALGQ